MFQSGTKRGLGLSDGPDAWNSGEEQSNSGDASDRKKKRRSRWNTDEDKIIIPGMPTVIPANLSELQQRQYVVHLQIEEITRKLRTGDLGIPANPEQRSPSPEPIYNNEGKRLNTREYRTRKKLEEERHKLIQEAIKLNPEFKPPSDYKPPVIRVSDKVMIPQEEHPDINFVGLLIGPRGNTLKTLEKDTGAKIIIRGKGSVKDGKIGRKDGQPLPGEDEPLHAYVTANNPENVKKAVEKIKDIIKQGIEVPEGQNDLRRQQLRELALLNGTLRENDGLAKLRQLAECQTIVTNTIICTVCGGTGHIAQDCKQKRPGDTFRMQQMQNPADRAKMDSEYMSLMAELGEGPPPPKVETTSSNQSNFGRPLLANPPPNPMAMNSPWQMNRPLMGPASQAPPLLSRPPMGMQNSPQINPLGRLPVPLMSTPMQPPPGMQAPPSLLSSSSQQQQQQMMGGMGNMSQMQQQQGSNMMRPWQQQSQQMGPQVNQQMMSMNNQMNSNSGSMAMPPPPPSLLAPPPPPPSSNQNQTTPPWMQQAHAGLQAQQPPPPPVSSPTAPWQQQAPQMTPPPPPVSLAPWQQPPPPPAMSAPPPPSPVQPPSLAVPPPPPQSSPSQQMQYNSFAPPPPPPMSYNNQRMGGITPLMMAGPPPPPPPS
ncbi:splicing factor 1-like [Physella acuta]|uniref:splicing factor 1-like n=1 Tax=Physella acuta TaxID=109671 RepID=UPI0027DD73B8|nr:splicing factor 1-like [Physella acuta]